jgi:hypothetical protein
MHEFPISNYSNVTRSGHDATTISDTAKGMPERVTAIYDFIFLPNDAPFCNEVNGIGGMIGLLMNY